MSRRLMTNHVCSLAVILLCAQTAGSAGEVEPPAGSVFPVGTVDDGWTVAETDIVQPRTRNAPSDIRIPVLTLQDSSAAESSRALTASFAIPMTVTRLRAESRISFDRALLPLADHLENLALAEVGAVSQVPRKQVDAPWTELDHPALLRALEPRLRELRRTVERLERFQQPAAAGYDADVALARYALADASLQAAYLTGETNVIPRLSAARERIAVQRYHQLIFDYHVLGTASLPEIAGALAMRNIAPQIETQFRGTVTRQTQQWRDLGAGIGRNDNLPRAKLELAESQFQLARRQENSAAIAEQLATADRLAQTLLTSQRSRWRSGTVTLGEMARSWQLRWQIHQQAERNGLQFSAGADRSLDADLQSLTQLARGQRDRRGRIAADVLRIELLGGLRETATVR